MSTIVYRDGVLAADTRAYSGNLSPVGQKNKIRRFSDGTLVGCSTAKVGVSERLFRWVHECIEEFGSLTDPRIQDPRGDFGSFTMIAVDGKMRAYLFNDGFCPSGPLTAPYFAIGSGRDFALGAMRHGACALDAARVACGLDVWSDLPITALKHDGHAWGTEK